MIDGLFTLSSNIVANGGDVLNSVITAVENVVNTIVAIF